MILANICDYDSSSDFFTAETRNLFSEVPLAWYLILSHGAQRLIHSSLLVLWFLMFNGPVMICFHEKSQP